MVRNLPPEILFNIIYQVFHHTRHLRTLHALLCSSKLLLQETARVLYYDPFKATTLAMDPATALHKLTRLLFSLSPFGDDIREFKSLLGIPTIENPMIDYVSYILSDEVHLEEAYDTCGRYRLKNYESFQGTESDAQDLACKAQAALAWTIYDGRLHLFQRIHVPCSSLDWLMSHVDQLTRLEVLEVSGIEYIEAWDERQSPTLKALVKFVKRMQSTYGPSQLKDIRKDRPLFFMDSERLYKELDSLLPPMSQPTTFSMQKMWRSFWSRDITKIDLSCVRTVYMTELYSELHDIYRDNLIQQCRSLQSLTSYREGNCGRFRWAAEERRKYDEVQAQKEELLVTTVAVPQPVNAISNTLPPLVPLRKISLSRIDSPTLEDVMYAFQSSLEEADLYAKQTMSMEPCGATWNLPKLRSLQLGGELSGFVLHPRAMDHLPNLRHLRIDSFEHIRSMRNLSDLLQKFPVLDPWTHLAHLWVLHLSGFAYTAFHPSSLSWMPNLEVLQVAGPRLKSFFIYTGPPHDRPETKRLRVVDTPYPNTELWTWDWFMPSLRHIDLQGEPAFRFRFQWLQQCPSLEVLILDIRGTTRKLSVFDFVITNSHDNGSGQHSSSLQPLRLSTTLKELCLMEGQKNGWFFSSSTAISAMLKALGPQLTTLHCSTTHFLSVSFLAYHAKKQSGQHLRRLDLSPSITSSTRRDLGLKHVGRVPSKKRASFHRHLWFLLHKVPSVYHNSQLWIFGTEVYVTADEIERLQNLKVTN